MECQLGATPKEARGTNIEKEMAAEENARRQENRMTPAKQEDPQQKANATQEQIEQHNREMAAKYKEVLGTETRLNRSSGTKGR